MASLKEIVSMYQNLKREWDKKPSNLDKCGELLGRLKVKAEIVKIHMYDRDNRFQNKIVYLLLSHEIVNNNSISSRPYNYSVSS